MALKLACYRSGERMHELTQQHFVDGAWIEATGAQFTSENPATGERLWQGNAAGQKEIQLATESAAGAFHSWRTLSFDQRHVYVLSFVAIVKRREELHAKAIHEETGKPLWESKTEIATMIAKATISVKAYQQRTGSHHSENNNMQLQLTHRPLGVFAVLGPYNFPGHLPNGHIIPALLAGNTIVFKPSELTPRFGELMVQCWNDAGLPAGVMNLVQGGSETGELLAKAPLLDGLLFTGSSKTGKALHQSFAGKPDKMLVLEMGGNNPLVIEQVVDVEAAVYAVIQSAFISSGQRCTCARRLILVRNQANQTLLEKLRQATASIKVGADDDCFMGPLISNRAAEQVMAVEHSLVAAGANKLLALHRLDQQRPFVSPGIVDVTKVVNLNDEECFGPLLQLIWVDDMDAAMVVANQTVYGLAAGLLSDSESVWQHFSQLIRAGIVNWNRPLTGASGAAPFGGIGASGNFRPGAFYAADYSAYPMASMLSDKIELPKQLAPGIAL